MRKEPEMNTVGKERTILLFKSIILQGDCRFVEGFVSCERRRINNDRSEPSSTVEKREIVRSEREKIGTRQEQCGW